MKAKENKQKYIFDKGGNNITIIPFPNSGKEENSCSACHGNFCRLILK